MFRVNDAPTTPGVYVLLGAGDELLYVGKATNLRRRIRDHLRSGAKRFHDVRWIACEDEAAALCLEADLICALCPPLNAAIAEESYAFVFLETSGDVVRFTLAKRPPDPGARAFGGFVHLGKGKVAWPAIRCNAGYSALLRLLWTAHAPPAERERIPARLRGKAPPLSHETPLPRPVHRSVFDFLAGRSARLVQRIADPPPLLASRFASDLVSAGLFFRMGPAAVRARCIRHGVAEPLDEETFRRLVADELRDAIGDVKLPERSSDAALIGARAARGRHFRNLRATGSP